MQAGDLVICHSKGLIGGGIRWSQRHMQDNPYAEWNHVAVLDRIAYEDDDGDAEWFIIQAEAKGVTNNRFLSSVAPGGSYAIVTLPDTIDRNRFLEFLRFQVGAKYGYLSILSCALDMFLPNAICLRKADTWICSALVGAGLMYFGFRSSLAWPDLYTITPAEIAQHIADMK